MKCNVWCCLLAVFSLGLLAACQSSEVEPAGASQEVVFRVMNYMQYSLDEVTRSDADALDHLVFGVFDAETDALVGSIQTQDEGSSGYGTFSVKLQKGSYRLVFLGYDKDYVCQMTSSSVVCFESDAVPQTFLHSMTLTVGDEPLPAQSVVLKRAVGAFRLIVSDALPSNLATMRFAIGGGSTKLNGRTGFAADNGGRTFSLSVPSSYLGRTDIKLNSYVFLPDGETEIDITVDALTANGSVIRSRTFPKVPMMINRLITYEGNFFAASTSDMSASITVDNEWHDEVTVNF
ncbi:MAG: FimB/Mfa2 family fimbrial subunit [Bacteroidaceae bacterium]|nr:FimB/Mfa2 family fimbrial subunit [Bacteroidaceae bacterium]